MIYTKKHRHAKNRESTQRATQRCSCDDARPAGRLQKSAGRKTRIQPYSLAETPALPRLPPPLPRRRRRPSLSPARASRAGQEATAAALPATSPGTAARECPATATQTPVHKCSTSAAEAAWGARVRSCEMLLIDTVLRTWPCFLSWLQGFGVRPTAAWDTIRTGGGGGGGGG